MGGGGTGLAEVGSKQLRGAAGAAATAGPGLFWSTFLTKIKSVSPPPLFFAALQTVSRSSSQTWRMEMKRRLQSGEMLPEDVRRRYGDLK